MIGREGNTLLIIEVKMRMGARSGYPGEAVDGRKQHKICRVFDYFRMKNRLNEYVPVRFDVVEVDGMCRCHWIKNAFEYHI